MSRIANLVRKYRVVLFAEPSIVKIYFSFNSLPDEFKILSGKVTLGREVYTSEITSAINV